MEIKFVCPALRLHREKPKSPFFGKNVRKADAFQLHLGEIYVKIQTWYFFTGKKRTE